MSLVVVLAAPEWCILATDRRWVWDRGERWEDRGGKFVEMQGGAASAGGIGAIGMNALARLRGKNPLQRDEVAQTVRAAGQTPNTVSGPSWIVLGYYDGERFQARALREDGTDEDVGASLLRGFVAWPDRITRELVAQLQPELVGRIGNATDGNGLKDAVCWLFARVAGLTHEVSHEPEGFIMCAGPGVPFEIRPLGSVAHVG